MKFKAAIFDLDGVVTDTAKIHAAAWKTMFDYFLKRHLDSQTMLFHEFTYNDYLQYVDGLPRIDGIKNFLMSRSIDIPLGNPEDSIQDKTIHGLGNYKNKLFNDILIRDGAEIFYSTIKLLEELKNKNIKTAVASSSKNCKTIIEQSKLEEFFDARVDGTTLDELKLAGKPLPDMFLEAAKRLEVKPATTMVVEDAISGVQAAHRGKFGLVVGIDRKGTITEDLKNNGADIVVSDMGELSLEDIENYFQKGGDKT